MQNIQKAARTVFGVTLTGLIPFLIVKGTQPAGHAVLWILYGILIVSGLVWLLTTLLLWRMSKGGATPSDTDPCSNSESEPVAFQTSSGGTTIVEGGKVRGYRRVSSVTGRGSRARFINVKFWKR